MEVFGDERPLAARAGQHPRRARPREADRRAPASPAQIKIVENYDPSLPPVPGNRDKLIQVFLNLVKNAAEAIGEERADGQITLTTSFRPGVRLSVPGSQARVSLPLEIAVEDNGAGVPDRPHAASVRSLRHHQAVGHRARPGAGRQDHRRPRRHHRMRLAAQAHRLPRAAADGRERDAAQSGQA